MGKQAAAAAAAAGSASAAAATAAANAPTDQIRPSWLPHLTDLTKPHAGGGNGSSNDGQAPPKRERLATAPEASANQVKRAGAGAKQQAPKENTGGKGRGRRRGGRRRNRERDEPIECKVKDKGLRQWMQVMTTATLSLLQSNRFLMGVSVDTFLAAREDSLVKAIEEEGELFNKLVEVRRTERAEALKNDDPVPPPLPPPFFATVVAFLAALLKREVGEDLRASLEPLLADLRQDSEIIATFVGGLKLMPCADTKRIKIVIAMNQLPQRPDIIKAIKRLPNITHTLGSAPPGFLEEELGDWMDHLRGASRD